MKRLGPNAAEDRLEIVVVRDVNRLHELLHDGVDPGVVLGRCVAPGPSWRVATLRPAGRDGLGPFGNRP